MSRFSLPNLGDPLSLDGEVCSLLNESEHALSTAFNSDILEHADDAMGANYRLCLITAAQVRATHALTLSVQRLAGLVEASFTRIETVDDADDFVSLEDDLERLPPEKTASGE